MIGQDRSIGYCSNFVECDHMPVERERRATGASNNTSSNMTSRRMFLRLGGAMALLLTAAPARAAKAPVNTGFLSNTAVGGYDVVAYFTDNAAVEGMVSITAEHDGASYRFASAAHRDAFLADPARYLPQYGGYCAYAVSQGHTASVDPEAWTIVDGKLYLNYSREVRAIWQSDVPRHIRLADGNWPGVLDR